ncbi:hypothetical protein D8S78_10295 [Natrialba swarupiae]|nr:hypothetical protein [Natrialba swarupiae]
MKSWFSPFKLRIRRFSIGFRIEVRGSQLTAGRKHSPSFTMRGANADTLEYADSDVYIAVLTSDDARELTVEDPDPVDYE